MSHTDASGPLAERLLRIHRLVDDCVSRRLAGETVRDEDVLREHPELLPELRDELRNAQLIERARRGRCASSEQVTRSIGGGAKRLGQPLVDELPGYTIQDEIHRGGQGVVHRALQTSTGRTVAIKLTLGGAAAGPRELSRLQREVQALAAVRHPNVVTIHDSGVSVSGALYFVMDYIEGVPLDRYIEAGGPPRADGRPNRMGVRDVVRLFTRLCDAVHAAHVRGVIHRDLKPSNVRVDRAGAPHVLDFGLAKFTDSSATELTQTGQFVGSLPWASPEQAGGDPDAVDLRSDVYSLGVMLYQMLTGVFPYDVRTSLHAVLQNIREAEPMRPRELRRDLDDEIETILLRCLAKDPQRRYQTAGDLQRDLQRYLAGEPIAAKRDSTAYLVRKLAQRHRTPVLLGVSFVAVIGLGLGISLTQWQRAESALALADRRAKHIGDSDSLFFASLGEVVELAGRGAPVLLSDVLGALERRLNVQPPSPEVEARARARLGEFFVQLGDADRAEPNLQRASELCARSEEIDPAIAADCAIQLTNTALLRNDLDLAAQRVNAAREILREASADELTRAQLDFAHGSLLTLKREAAAARPLLEGALRVFRARAPHLAGRAMTAYAGCLERLDELQTAHEVQSQALQELVTRFPETSRLVRNGRITLAHIAIRRGEFSAALEITRRLAKQAAASRDEQARVLMLHGMALCGAGDLAAAEAALRNALDIRTELYPADHLLVALTRSELAQVALLQRRLDEAEVQLAAAAPVILPAGAAPGYLQAAARSRLIRLYESTGRLDDAERVRQGLATGVGR